MFFHSDNLTLNYEYFNTTKSQSYLLIDVHRYIITYINILNINKFSIKVATLRVDIVPKRNNAEAANSVNVIITDVFIKFSI